MRTRTTAPNAPTRRAFTLMEVIAVLVIMGITAVGLTMYQRVGYYSAEREADLLKSRIRYTQARAMGNNESWGIACTGSAYYQFKGSNTGARSAFPGASGDTYNLPDGVGASQFVLSFDAWGTPYANAAQSSPLSSTLDISLTYSSGGTTETASVNVTPVTGFVP